MKKNMRGFTLIELLAVIVILAIIALIATPIIMNVINDAKIGADRDGAYGVVKAVETSVAQEMVKDTSFPTLTGCEIVAGTPDACVSTTPAKSLDVNFKGTKPKSASIKFDAKGSVAPGTTVEMGTGTFTIGADGKFGNPTK